MTTNPYAPPTAVVADAPQTETAPAIWNPNAAANWSLLFSPAFGAFLHMRNWHALGELQLEAMAKRWFIAALCMLALYIVLGLALAGFKGVDAVTRTLAFGFLLVWYFSTARSQAKYVKEKFGKSYPRKSWGKPLLIAVVAVAGYILAAFLIGLVFGFAKWAVSKA
jgi:hypothetical protein